MQSNSKISGIKDVEKLFKYYLSCIEEEDLRSRRISLRAYNKQYIVPQKDEGCLFKGDIELSWDISEAEVKFFQRYTTEKEQPSYLYGYPVYRDRRGFLLPLFILEVNINITEGYKKATITPIQPDNLQLNLHLFTNTHPSLVERLDLQDVLESSEFGSFEDRLKEAFKQRQEPHTDFAKLVTPRGNVGWKNGSILFRDAGGHFTAQLRRELSVMQNLVKDAPNTSLGYLLNLKRTMEPALQDVDLIEIVSLNKSQRDAAIAALREPFAVITGPPGTGKSQVVVALIASMTAAGKSVLFVSKNNEAVEVVRRKLAEILKEDDWTLRLGSKRHIDLEMERLVDKAVSYKARTSTDLSEQWHTLNESNEVRKKIAAHQTKAYRLIQEYTATLDNRRKSISKLSEKWQDWLTQNPLNEWPYPANRSNIKTLIDDAEALSNKRWPGLWLFVLRLFYGHRLLRNYQKRFIKITTGRPEETPAWCHDDELSWDNLLKDLNIMVNVFDVQKENVRIEELASAIKQMPSSEQIKQDSEKVKEKIITLFQKICCTKIDSRIARQSALLPTILKEYWELTKKAASFYRKTAFQVQMDFNRAAKKLLSIIPAVIVTNLSAQRSIPLKDNIFECIIVDEASQCDIASALPLLFRAKRMVVIGDPKQLRHISAINEKNEQRIAAAEGSAYLLSRYSYRTKSLYDCCAETAVERGVAPVFLSEHYRSSPEIIEFSNRIYYGRRLIVRTSSKNDQMQSLLWHDVPSYINNGKGSLFNQKEAERVFELSKVIAETVLFDNHTTLGIVTPYKRQRNNIEDLLRASGILGSLGKRITIGTIHTFQGGETDIMIFSPVLTEGVNPRATEWISKEEGLLNVALTRARNALHIVGDKSYCLQTPGPLGELAQFVENLSESAVNKKFESPPIKRVCDLLNNCHLWYQREWPEGDSTRRYYLDFMVVGLSGTRYDIEVDGRQHYFSAEAINEDDVRDAFLKKQGYQIIRFRAKDIIESSSSMSRLIERLV